MFARVKQRKLYNAILKQCELHLDVYRKEVENLTKLPPTTSEAELDALLLSARKNYFNSVFDAMWAALPRISAADMRIRMATQSPGITGLPPDHSVDYLSDFGSSAGVTFAFFYYALWGTPVQSAEEFRTMSKLNHKQNDLMNMVLAEFDGAK